MRKHETKADLSREARVANFVAKKLMCLQKKSVESRVDRVFTSGGRAIFYGEIKCRSNPSTRYADYMVDHAKVRFGFDYAAARRMAFMLIVSFTDGVFWTEVEPNMLKNVTTGGRRDRDDEHDIDKVVMIPMSRFRKLGDLDL